MSEENENTGEEVDIQAAAGENEESENHSVDQKVPMSALAAERSKRQSLESENILIKENYKLLLAQAQLETPKESKNSDFEGLEDDDIMTVGEYKKLSSGLSSKFKSTVKELQMAQKNPDYQDVITKYLPEVIKNNPSLKDTLQKTQDYELAYYLAKNSEGYRTATMTTKRNSDAERIIKNSQSSGGLSSVGASTPVSQARRYKDMTDSDFSKLMERNKG